MWDGLGDGKRKGKVKNGKGLEGSELVRRGDSVYVWDEDGDKRRKIKCVPILLSRVERERRRAKKTLVGARARMERLKDGAWQGQQHPAYRCRKRRRVEKILFFLPEGKGGIRLSVMKLEKKKPHNPSSMPSRTVCRSHDTESYPPELDNSRQLRVLTKRLKRSERDGCQVERQDRKATYRTKQLK